MPAAGSSKCYGVDFVILEYPRFKQQFTCDIFTQFHLKYMYDIPIIIWIRWSRYLRTYIMCAFHILSGYKLGECNIYIYIYSWDSRVGVNSRIGNDMILQSIRIRIPGIGIEKVLKLMKWNWRNWLNSSVIPSISFNFLVTFSKITKLVWPRTFPNTSGKYITYWYVYVQKYHRLHGCCCQLRCPHWNYFLVW